MRQVPNNSKNPSINTLSTPVGIDRVIQTLQNELSSLPWLEKSFGRAFLQMKKNPVNNNRISDDNIFYPGVYQGLDANGRVKDFQNLLVNDNLSSYSFFYTDGDESPIDYKSDVDNFFEREISLIVWFNMDQINKDTDNFRLYPYQEELNQEVQDIISGAVFLPGDRVVIDRVVDDPKDIFNAFTLDVVKAQNLVYPNWGYRYYLTATYKRCAP